MKSASMNPTTVRETCFLCFVVGLVVGIFWGWVAWTW